MARRSKANKKKAIAKTAFSLWLNNILAILLELVLAVDAGAGERSDEEALGVDRFLAIFADAVFALLNLGEGGVNVFESAFEDTFGFDISAVLIDFLSIVIAVIAIAREFGLVGVSKRSELLFELSLASKEVGFDSI